MGLIIHVSKFFDKDFLIKNELCEKSCICRRLSSDANNGNDVKREEKSYIRGVNGGQVRISAKLVTKFFMMQRSGGLRAKMNTAARDERHRERWTSPELRSSLLAFLSSRRQCRSRRQGWQKKTFSFKKLKNPWVL